jgi:hypothetical protein
MSTNPDVDGVVTLRPRLDEADAFAPAAPGQTGLGEPAAAAAPFAEPQQTLVARELTKASDRARSSRPWLAALTVGVIGTIVAGTLGYFLYVTTGQRDAARRQAASTQATLTSTQATLTSAQATLVTTQQDLAARNATAAYASMYVTDSGRARIDYEKLVACNSFGSCRSAAQSELIDLQAFQSDRSAATVPPALANTDAALRSALSAAIAGDQQLISGFDTFSVSKVTAGLKKLNAAMLSTAKAEAVLGPELK